MATKHKPALNSGPSGADEFLARSTITSKGQVTIPQAIRAMFHLVAGDSILWRRDEKGGLLVEAGKPNTLADIRAAVALVSPAKTRIMPKTLEDMDAGIAAGIKAKYGRG